MESQKGPYKDYCLSKGGLYGFPCQFGGVYVKQPVYFLRSVLALSLANRVEGSLGGPSSGPIPFPCVYLDTYTDIYLHISIYIYTHIYRK